MSSKGSRKRKTSSSPSPTISGPNDANLGINTSTGGKTLSRREIYLPMVAYDAAAQGKFDNPHAYMESSKKLPNSVHEKNFVEFWHRIGVEYHRHRARVHEPKNSGNKPLTLADMEEKIRQRALTLVGGGINTDWAATGSNTARGSSSKAKQTATTTILHPKLQKAKQQRRNRNRHIIQSAMHFATDDPRVGRFLVQLNTMWNDYMHRLLGLPQKATIKELEEVVCRSNITFWSRVTSNLTKEKAQFVGAKVHIKSCTQHAHWKGRIGFLVRQTTNSWQLMVPMMASDNNNTKDGNGRRKKWKKNVRKEQQEGEEEACDSTKDQVTAPSNATTTNKDGWRTLVVPKRGSSLTLLIPIDAKEFQPKGAKTSRMDDTTSTSTLLAIDIMEEGK
ncbi:expressed unknown protein [Seminavis robusta]|uniref:Uncharacterized protein n=1 Tax=Seminavis robusta TaxID=568900 RepID=A0A9N8GZH4_9STRA|nr:expressed unknown protein [Seminavis robusta]|eukprot:Sro4_g003180.1 n/a (391) ;mRNA; f:65579-66751